MHRSHTAAPDGARPVTLNRRARRLAARSRRVAVAASVSVLGVAALAGPAAASTPRHHGHSHTTTYTYTTLDNQSDPTFNQLLGINNGGLIAGYFGSGQVVSGSLHPNKGYELTSPYGQQNYVNENFPNSVQTQVTGLNDRGVSVGFWVDQNGDNYGFYSVANKFANVNFPVLSDSTSATVDQLLGVNDRNIAVGFYTDANGDNHGYTFDIRRLQYHEIDVPGATSTTAAAINNEDQIAGFYVDTNNKTHGFLLSHGRTFTLDYPNATMTQALGINDEDEIVGVYTASDNTMHGFTWTARGGYQSVDDPNGIGTTTINGVNDAGDLVGFYTDAAGNTDGLLATPDNGSADLRRSH